MRADGEALRGPFGGPIPSRDQSGSHTKSSCVNFWIVIILVAGAFIVMTDGLTRDPLPEEGTEAPLPVLEYQASSAAYVFAFVSLPVCILYASQASAPLSEGILLWFVLGTVTYAKDFAYIRVPHTPLFVTDITLAVLLYSLARRFGLRWARPRRFWSKSLLAYVVIGCLCLLRGLHSEDKMLAVRDFGLVFYVLFLFVGIYVVRTWDAIRRFFLIVIVGAILSTLNGIFWFMSAQPGQRRFISFGIFVLTALVGTFICTTQRIIPRWVGWPLACLLATGVLLANARTLYLGLGLSLLVMLIITPSAKGGTPLQRLKIAVSIGLAAVLLALVLSQTSVGSAFLERTESELISGTFHYEDDPNGTFRIMAWIEALQRFQNSPLLGEGYGIPFVFELDDSDPRPHNTYLTVLYKMGLLGLLPLLLFLSYIQWKGWKVWRAFTDSRESVLLYTILVVQLVICAFGCLNLLLESPFLASIFWLSAGLTLRMTHLLRSSARPRFLAVQHA